MTTIAERLRALANLLPADGAISLTRPALLELAESETSTVSTIDTLEELTVAAIAGETGRAQSTVRGWFESGALKGFRFNNREWRCTRAQLDDYKRISREPPDRTPEPTGGKAPDLTAWRSRMRKAG